jgi:hypothetical protein
MVFWFRYGLLLTQIQPFVSTVVPQVAFVTSTSLGSCDGLSIDATASTGALGRAFASVQWQIVSSTTPVSPFGWTPAQLAVVTNALTVASAGKSATIKLAPAQVPEGSVITISLTLSNWLGASSTSRVSFSKSSMPSLPIILSGVPYITQSRSQSFSVSATTDYTLKGLCVALSSASLTVSFQWRQLFAWPDGLSNIGGVALSAGT